MPLVNTASQKFLRSESAVNTDFILTLSCPNRIGIVYAVAKFLFERGFNITDSAQYDDIGTDRFFMRVAFSATQAKMPIEDIKRDFRDLSDEFDMDWAVVDVAVRPRVAILVSKFDHCLRDLLYRHSVNELSIDIVAIGSNHRDLEPIASSHGIPFHHFPVTKETKKEQEAAVLAMLQATKADLLVLARYMQVLSDDLCNRLPCAAINIHHSFLPSFRGATPYQQAHARGVKVIGATAHYVTPELDEGPIIEQGVERVTHALTPQDLAAVGRDIEKIVLARAVKLHTERRILLNSGKTVVFS